MKQPLRYKTTHLALLSLTAALLAACGGAGTGDTTTTAVANNDRTVQAESVSAGASTLADAALTLRGAVLNASTVQTLSKKTIDNSVSAAEAPLVTGIAGATSAAGNAKCDVQLVKLVYSTIKPKDAPQSTQATTAAGAALLVPGAGCARPWPLLSQQHGTSIAAQAIGPEGIYNAAAYYGSQGYVVVMPAYHGYEGSGVKYHPYLQAEPSAAVVIDAVRAARNWLRQNGHDGSMGSKLFLAGTSEGGFVTMAAQRTMERYFASEFAITATVPISGPYQVEGTFDQFMNVKDTTKESKTVAATFILEGFQKTYGDIYDTPSTIYNAPWDAGMGTTPPLLPSTTASTDKDLRKSCQLPFNLKDDPTDGTPTYTGCAATPLLTTTFVDQYRDNWGYGAQVRVRAQQNNLLQDWTPTSPTFVCYGGQDTMATPNALAAQSYFQARGATALLTMEDLETETQPVIAQWMDTQTPLHPPGAGYHGQVEAPACTSWARHSVFDTLR